MKPVLVNLLRAQGIEVGTTTTAVTVKEGTFPVGSYVVKRDQPYGRLAKTLEKQLYPDTVTRTYDDASWTMGLMSHVEVREIADKAVLVLALTPVGQVRLAGTVSGAGSTFAIAHYGSNHMVTLRTRLKGMKVRAAEKEFVEGGLTFPAGSFIVSGDATVVRPAVEALGLTAVAMASEPAVPMHDVDLPRVGVYSTWGSTQDVGWVRYSFDQFELPYEVLYKERVRQGHLNDAYDVIVIPSLAGASQTAPTKRLVFDIASRGAPIPYKKSERFKYLGMYGESDDITGGMGIEGVAALDTFVKTGGVLVTLGNASFFPADFGLVPNIDAARPSPQFYAPGTIIDADILQPEHPLFYGYATKTISVRYGNGPLLSVQTGETPPPEGPPPTPNSVLLRYPGGDDHVLSGLMRGALEIRNRPGIIDQVSGKGRVVLFAGNPCYRWQNFGEFNMLFNLVLNYNDIKPAATTPAPDASK